jgi:hypothetical protein
LRVQRYYFFRNQQNFLLFFYKKPQNFHFCFAIRLIYTNFAGQNTLFIIWSKQNN